MLTGPAAQTAVLPANVLPRLVDTNSIHQAPWLDRQIFCNDTKTGPLTISKHHADWFMNTTSHEPYLAIDICYSHKTNKKHALEGSGRVYVCVTIDYYHASSTYRTCINKGTSIWIMSLINRTQLLLPRILDRNVCGMKCQYFDFDLIKPHRTLPTFLTFLTE